MDPIDQAVWNGGIGGHNPNGELEGVKHASGTIKEANQFLKN